MKTNTPEMTKEMKKAMGNGLQRAYGAAVEQPLNWTIIDRLTTLAETEGNPDHTEPAR